MYSLKAREEEIKSRVREDYFGDYDCSNYLGNIDFSVAIRKDGKELFPDKEYLMWAEAKHGDKQPLWESLIQLIFTIGKERTNEKALPPKFLGAFDAEKIAMIPFSSVMEVFSQNDFNWNVAPSDHNSKEFALLKKLVRAELDKSGKEGENVFVFYFDNDSKELKKFIRKNFVSGRDAIQRMRISPNNFTTIYEKWRKEVKPSILVDWEKAREKDIVEADFFLADLMSTDNKTILEKLRVLLKSNQYLLKNKIDNDIFTVDASLIPVEFGDKMAAHTLFWSKYARPPKKQYWNYMVDRRDLLIPQDIRERKGSYFTPKIWVAKAQEYIADFLGENWQDEYYVWDCCAGTGNLLQYLSNKKNIWASTLDEADVAVMKQQISLLDKGARLFSNQVFQFDFLNDEFDKLPNGLKEIIYDEEKRKKLVIFINPPYAETMSYGEKSKEGNNISRINEKYKKELKGCANREIFAQFIIRIYKEIPSCILANFSTLKIIQAPNFEIFNNYFDAKLERLFIVPSNTFDNVKGSFPIGFFIWNTAQKKDRHKIIIADIYNSKGEFEGTKEIYCETKHHTINDWIISKRDNTGKINLGFMACLGNDFQSQKLNYILSRKDLMAAPRGSYINEKNLLESLIYLSVRQCIPATWINNRDQFLFPNNGWITDYDFQSDCICYALFHGQNKVSSEYGTNHWIPFSEAELDSPNSFESNFMYNFLIGRQEIVKDANLFESQQIQKQVIHFTPTAQAVFDAGREIWYYYIHINDNNKALFGGKTINVNASFYDIRKYFQGVDEKGKMNSDSPDEEYMRLIKDLREKQKVLAKQIEEKVYKYGFLYNGEPREDDDIVEVEAEEVVTPAVVKKSTPTKKKKEQTIIVQNIQVNGDLNVQTLIGSADIKK